MDRVERIMAELAKCADCRYEGDEVTTVYMGTESIGVIATQAMALRREVEVKENEISCMRDRIKHLNTELDQKATREKLSE